MFHSDQFYNFPSMGWKRCQYYIEDGYIKPVHGSKVIHYNPFDFYVPPGIDKSRKENSIWLEFSRINIDNNEEILGFVNKYGLLGLLPFKTHNNFVRIDNIGYYRYRGNLISAEELHAHYKMKGAITDVSKKLHLSSEPISEVIDVIRKYQSVVNSYIAFTKLELYEDFRKDEDAVKLVDHGIILPMQTYSERISQLLFIDPVRQNKFTWYLLYDSLISAIYFMLSMAISGNWYIRKCNNEKCGQAFATDVHNKFHCCTRCGDATRQRRKRSSKKNLREQRCD